MRMVFINGGIFAVQPHNPAARNGFLRSEKTARRLPARRAEGGFGGAADCGTGTCEFFHKYRLPREEGSK
jgi:hypothetical protein